MARSFAVSKRAIFLNWRQDPNDFQSRVSKRISRKSFLLYPVTCEQSIATAIHAEIQKGDIICIHTGTTTYSRNLINLVIYIID